MATCTHLDTLRDVAPSDDGCHECLATGGRWVHLRMCQELRARPAAATAPRTGTRPRTTTRRRTRSCGRSNRARSGSTATRTTSPSSPSTASARLRRTAEPPGRERRVRILAVSDLHYRLRQLDWLLAAAPSFDAVTIAGDLLDVRSPVALDVQAVAVTVALRALADETAVFAASGNHDLDGRDAAEKAPAGCAASPPGRARRQHVDPARGRPGDGLPLVGRAARARGAGPGPGRGADRPGGAGSGCTTRRPRAPLAFDGRRAWGDDVLSGWIARSAPDVVLTGHVHQAPFARGGDWDARVGSTVGVQRRPAGGPGARARHAGPGGGHGRLDLGRGPGRGPLPPVIPVQGRPRQLIAVGVRRGSDPGSRSALSGPGSWSSRGSCRRAARPARPRSPPAPAGRRRRTRPSTTRRARRTARRGRRGERGLLMPTLNACRSSASLAGQLLVVAGEAGHQRAVGGVHRGEQLVLGVHHDDGVDRAERLGVHAARLRRAGRAARPGATYAEVSWPGRNRPSSSEPR